MTRSPRSKTLATWLAVVGGTLGLHRLYLHGPGDRLAWLHPLPTLLGLAGVVRLRNLGLDDPWGWLLAPVLGLMVSLAMAQAIVLGLTPDERWAGRHGGGAPMQPTGWGPVLGVITALLVGGAALMGTIAYSGEKFFEWQRLTAAASQPDAARGRSADQNSSVLNQ